VGTSTWRYRLVVGGARPRAGMVVGIGLAVLAWAYGGGWSGLIAREGRGRQAELWRVGSSAAIAVHDGRSTFQVPLSGPSAEILVVVSALNRSRGPFPVHLTVKPTDRVRAPELADDGPHRAGSLRAAAPVRCAGPPPEPPRELPPKTREFHMLVRDGDVSSPGNYAGIHGVLKGVGRRIQIYVAAEDLDRVSGELIKDLVVTFDDRIYPLAFARFGTANDVDRDGRFTILLSSWLDHLGGGRFSVDGFVRGSDLDTDVRPPFGNQCDMMYLSTELKAGPHVRTVLAHEYMHAVIYSQKTLLRRQATGIRVEEEGWLDEALAHLFEDMHGFSESNIDYRISAFLSVPERYQLVVDDYYAENLFRSHGNRGSTYLFLRWCADQYGPELAAALIHSDLRGAGNLESATGATFAALYRRWSLALYHSGLDPREKRDRNSDDFVSLETRSPHDQWELVGPRFSRVGPGSPIDRWTALGTTSHFVIVDGFPQGGVEIDVSGPPEAELQVTAVPLGADSAGLDLSASTIRGPDGELRLRARVHERHGESARLSAVSWEPLVPSAAASPGAFRCGRIDMLGIAASFGTSALSASGELNSRPIPLRGVTALTGPLVVKVVGTDARGRRIAAWADLNADRDASEQ
jgi:hypothetical protein